MARTADRRALLRSEGAPFILEASMNHEGDGWKSVQVNLILCNAGQGGDSATIFGIQIYYIVNVCEREVQ